MTTWTTGAVTWYEFFQMIGGHAHETLKRNTIVLPQVIKLNVRSKQKTKPMWLVAKQCQRS